MAETVIPVKLSKGETYEQDLQGHLEQSAEQLGSGIGNRPEPREGTFPAEKYTGGVYALTLALALGLTWPSGAWGGG